MESHNPAMFQTTNQRVNPMKTIAPMVGFSMDIVPINQ